MAIHSGEALATSKAHFTLPTHAATATGLTALPCGRNGDVAHLLVTGDGLGADGTSEHRDGQGGRQCRQAGWHRPHNTGQHLGRCGKCATLNTLAGHVTTGHKTSMVDLRKLNFFVDWRLLMQMVKKSIM